MTELNALSNRQSVSDGHYPFSAMHYPFSAIVGQETFKLALLLAAINPALGGVVVSGPRGSAKSTLARALADLLPSQALDQEQKQPAEFVTLPLGASEEMLLGSLDLQKVLDQQEVVFRPGLLSRAHGGVLYVDEVNLLPDYLVDQLLDVAASGINRIERDGISHSHPAKCLLIGTMNPEEGELRPQLLDRFGLCVQLDNHYQVQDRIEIVRLREAFDRDPVSFCCDYEQAQQRLQQTVQQARELLPTVLCRDALRYQIAERCCAAQVDGLRADIVCYRAAAAHAALQQRQEITEADILAVEELVLVHRRNVSGSNPNSSSGSGSGSQDNTQHTPENKPQENTPNDQYPQDDQGKSEHKPSSPFKRPEGSKRRLPAQAGLSQTGLSQPDLSEDTQGAQDSKAEGDWGQLTAEQQQAYPLEDTPVLPSLNWQRLQPNPSAPQRRRGLSESALQTSIMRSGGAKGSWRKGGGALGDFKIAQTKQTAGAVDWFKTLSGWFKTLPQAKGQQPLRSLVFQTKRQSQPILHLVMLDSSGSLLNDEQGRNRLEQAKALVEQISQHAYLKRQPLALIGFGNQQVQVFTGKKAPKSLKGWLNQLSVGGGTPLREALQQASRYLRQALRQQPTLHCYNYLFTDGRTTASFSDLALAGETLLIDTEQSTIKRGRCMELATQLSATYIPLAELLSESFNADARGAI